MNSGFPIVGLAIVLCASFPQALAIAAAQGGSDKAAVLQFFDTWLEAERSASVDRLVNAVTDDCVFLLPGREPVKGKNEVRGLYEEFFAAYRGAKIEHHVAIEDVQTAGGYAFFWGLDELSITGADGKVVRARGYGLGVLKRAEDGRWQSFRAINNLARSSEK